MKILTFAARLRTRSVPLAISFAMFLFLINSCTFHAKAAETNSAQQILLSPLEADSDIGKGGWKLNALSAAPAAEVPPKLGQSAMRLAGDAEAAGAKGDFTLAGAVPGNCQSLSLWIYLPAGANVETLGFQIYDAEGEALLSQVPADWTGWKQITWDLQNGPLKQAYDQPGKNKKADSPLASVHIAWFAKAAGPTSLVVDALDASTVLTETSSRLDAQISGATSGEPNVPMAAQLFVLTNFASEPRTAKVDYTVQRDPALYSVPPPDPVYGSDEARGAKSWTEAEGKTLEEGSLTDGKDWTNALLPWGSHKEAFQYVDLGRERTVTHLAYLAGDANWAWKVDISASLDGKTYQPVSGLQGIDTHSKWGRNEIAVPQPFAARFIRLRHHNNGQDVNQIAMPSTLSVYDGTADEKWELPVVGETIARGTVAQTVAARSFATLSVSGEKPLAPGAYLIAARVQDGARTQMVFRHFMVMPAPLASVAASRFGLNTSNFLWAPLNRRLGIGWVRFENMKWPMISPRPDVFNYHGNSPWNLDHDVIVKAYHDQGMNFLPFLFQTPEYATSAPAAVQKNRESYPPRDNAQMGDFVFQTVARYGSQKHPAAELKTSDKKTGLNEINTYEIWNEPNLHDPNWGPWVGTMAQYNAMFRVAAAAVKRADPTARVTNGGAAGIDIETMNSMLLPYADGKKPLDFVDILNVHYYSGRVAPEIATMDANADRSGAGKGANTFEDALRRLIAWRDKNKPGLPIWMSETGYDSAGPSGTDEQTQAAQLPRVIMMALAAGVEKVIVYRESGSTPSLFAASGVMRDDGSLKPSWFTYATMIRALDGVKGGGRRLPYPDPNVRLYAWTRGTETILSAWAIDGKATLSLKLGSSTVTDAFGSTRQADIQGTLPLSIFPTYITKVGNPAALQALTHQAQSDEAARKLEQARLVKTQAYLFDFGSRDSIGTIDIGDTRSFTPVLGSDVYEETKAYGFFPKPAGQDNVAGWISDPLERDSTRMNPDHTFRFRAKPGRYQLRISISPQGPGQLTVKGGLGGDKVLPVAPNGPVVATEIEIGAEPMSISNSAYGDIHWLTLIEDSTGPKTP